MATGMSMHGARHATGGGATASGSGGGKYTQEAPRIQKLSDKAIRRIENDGDLCGQYCLVLTDMTAANHNQTLLRRR